MVNSFIAQDFRERIKIQGEDFDELFSKPVIEILFRQLNINLITVAEFEMCLLSWTLVYLENRKIEIRRVQKLQSVERQEKISNIFKQASSALKNLTEDELEFLKTKLNRINSSQYRNSEIRNTIVKDEIIDESTKRLNYITPESILAGFELLQECLADIPDKELFQHNHKVSNHEINILISQIAEFWTSVLQFKFTRQFHNAEPISRAARFCCAVLAQLDPTIELKEEAQKIDTAMKAKIKKLKAKSSFIVSGQ